MVEQNSFREVTGAQEGNRTPDLRITSATKSNSVGTLSTSKNRDGLQINQLDVRLDFGEPPTTTLDNCGIATKLLRRMNPMELMLAYLVAHECQVLHFMLKPSNAVIGCDNARSI